MQPIIADGYAHGHLRHVQEMGGVPVAEGGNGQQLLLGPLQVPLVLRGPVGVGEVKHPPEALAGNGQKPPAHLNPFHRRLRQQRVTLGQDRAVQLLPGWIGSHVLFKGNLLPRQQQQPRVGRQRLTFREKPGLGKGRQGDTAPVQGEG